MLKNAQKRSKIIKIINKNTIHNFAVVRHFLPSITISTQKCFITQPTCNFYNDKITNTLVQLQFL